MSRKEPVLMSIEQTPPPCDPLHLLSMEKLRRMLLDKSGPITWEVSDTWVACDGDGWTIGADEPATEDQVRELMVRAGGVAKVVNFE